MNRGDDQFLNGQFAWFIGRVEDINDPKNLNRVKVFPYGYFNENDEKIIENLPWSTVMMPNTSASLKGVGGNHHLEVGSWVVGFFRDGPSAQDAIIMGSIATKTDGTRDIPSYASIDNKVYESKAGHKIEIDNSSGSEQIRITHKTGSYIKFQEDGTIELKGNTKVVGTLHATGDISTDAGNSPTLATHKHIEVPGTGGASSPVPAKQLTSVADESIS